MSRKRKTNKYCVFQKPLLGWESWELVHTFDHTKERPYYYPNYLVYADSERSARALAIHRVYDEYIARDEKPMLLSTIFYGMCGLYWSDDEICTKLGEQDAKIFRRFYDKFTEEAMDEFKVDYDRDLDDDDYDCLEALNSENKYLLFEIQLWDQFLVLQIDHIIDSEK